MNAKIKAWYADNREFANDCADFSGDPETEMMYDGFTEFMRIMALLKEVDDES